MNHTMGFDFNESAMKRKEDALINSIQSTNGSSPRRRTSPGKSPGKKKLQVAQKSIRFNYYDPEAYDDPRQFYQWHVEKARQDLMDGYQKMPDATSASSMKIMSFNPDQDYQTEYDNSGGHQIYVK